MLENFLAKLGASTKVTVGVSISPSVGLEMIEIDRTTGTVSKYAHRPLDYNHSTREISDYNQFQSSLEELFEELHLPKRTNIVISIPNVHFGLMSLPLLLGDDGVTNAIVSEVEQSYIFKRQEPVVSWAEIYSNIDTENRILAYTAIQKTVMDGIIQACEEVGCTIVGLENSYVSLLRALSYSGMTRDQMKEGISWNLMLIGQNSYSILSMVDKKIMEYYEEPLALKSFVDDEIYNAITTSAQLTLAGLPANHLFIVSETDLVSAEVLSIKINTESLVNFLECNKYSQDSMLPANLNILPNLALQMSPEAIGSAAAPFHEFPLKLNFIQGAEGSTSSAIDTSGTPKINIGNVELEITPEFVKKLSILFGVIVVLPIFIAVLVLEQSVIPKLQADLQQITDKITTANAEITKYNNAEASSAFDVKTQISKIVGQNKTKLAYYSALGMSIPNNLWINYYKTNEAGKIDIKGRASNVESVYSFYKDLKQMVNDSDVRLYKLEVASESIDDVIASSSPKYYEFEITNMSEAELNPPVAVQGATPGAPGAATQPAQQPQPVPSPQQGPLPTPTGKPLFGPNSGTPTPGSTSGGEQLPSNLQPIGKF